MSETQRQEITRRGWWVLHHHGYKRPHSGNLKCRDARFDEFLIRRFPTNYFMIFRTRKSTGRLYIEFSSDESKTGRNPDYDEWQRIVNALRQCMVLQDMADA